MKKYTHSVLQYEAKIRISAICKTIRNSVLQDCEINGNGYIVHGFDVEMVRNMVRLLNAEINLLLFAESEHYKRMVMDFITERYFSEKQLKMIVMTSKFQFDVNNNPKKLINY